MHAADGSVMSCNFLVGAGNTGHGGFVDRMGVQYDIADVAFGKWMKTQSKTPKEVRDPVADALVAALSRLISDKSFKLGTKGYVVRCANLLQRNLPANVSLKNTKGFEKGSGGQSAP